MRTALVSKSFSVFISLALVGGSLPVTGYSAETNAAMPEFVKALTPSERLGYVDSYYQGNTPNPVVLIQDLHSNYGVQQKIEGILSSLQPKIAATRPMVIGLEGAWGDISVASLRNQPAKIRTSVTDFLLKNVEITGMEHFAVMSEKDVKLVGIDNPEDYMVHSQLFAKSLAARLSLAKKTDQLRLAMSDSKSKASSALQRLWKSEEAFHSGRMSLADLSKKLGVSLNNYKEAEEALSAAKLSLAQKEKGDEAMLVKNLTTADENLGLLGRLLRQQLTLEEVQVAAKKIPAMLATVRVMLPGENTKLWSDTIQSAIDHYAVALLRDKPLSEHALELARQNAESAVVVVTGGFHTSGITHVLKANRVSYMVIAPIVESHTARDEQLYVERMLDIHVTDGQIAEGISMRPSVQSMPPASVQVLNLADNKQMASLTNHPVGRTVVGRALSFVLRGIRGSAIPNQGVQSQAVGKLVEPVELNPGALVKIGDALKRLATGEIKEIPIQQTPSTATDATQISLGEPSVAPNDAGFSRTGVAVALGVTAVGVAAILTQLPVHDIAARAHEVVNSATGSTALRVGAGLVAAGGALWAGLKKDKNGKTPLQKAAEQAAFGGAA